MTDADVAGPSRPRKVTLRDVAALAGVSIATASKALNGRDQVSEETRRRVLTTADRLSFTPNSLAQAILQGRSGTVGLLTNDLDGRFSLPILMGAEDAFGAGQMSVLLSDARDDAIREQYHLKALVGRQVDGLIVVGSRTDPRTSLGRQVSVPVIYAYAPSIDPHDASVIADNVRAGEIAVEHLLTLGRRRIAHITGDRSYAAARDRVVGAAAALDAAGLDLIAPAAFGGWSEAWGRTAATSLLDAGAPVDAIVCGSDQIARGVLDALRDRGVGVPDDIAVVGFDNWEPIAIGARPGLTSIDMRFETMGRRAAQRLFAALEGADSPGIESIEPRLVVRGSTVAQS